MKTTNGVEITFERDANGNLHPVDFDSSKVPYPAPTRCQHILCRAGAHRQDLQCTKRVHGPDVRHYHSIALGYCEARFADLVGPGSGGHKGGHTNPVIG